MFVLGDPQILERHLLPGDQEAEEAPEEQGLSRVDGLRKRLSPLGRLFRRDEASTPEEAPSPGEDAGTSDSAAPRSSEPAIEIESQPASEESRAGFFGRFTARVRSVLPRRQSEPEEIEVAEEEPDVPDTVLLFSYCPQLEALHAADGSPQVPEGLTPLCHLRYTERIRAGAIRTIQRFSETGVSIKILASGSVDRTITLLQQAGFGAGSDTPPASISGEELAGMDEAQLAEATIEHTVFGHIVPEQAGLLVGVLREQGESVAYIGEGVGDVPAMRQANLSITGQGGSQAALSVADIVLLKDSAEVLLDVLDKGQRIVNGLLDVLKLYLTQMIYLTLMIVAIRVLAGGFPYTSKQGTVIAVLTLSLPAIVLSLWASPGTLAYQEPRQADAAIRPAGSDHHKRSRIGRLWHLFAERRHRGVRPAWGDLRPGWHGADAGALFEASGALVRGDRAGQWQLAVCGSGLDPSGPVPPAGPAAHNRRIPGHRSLAAANRLCNRGRRGAGLGGGPARHVVDHVPGR